MHTKGLLGFAAALLVAVATVAAQQPAPAPAAAAAPDGGNPWTIPVAPFTIVAPIHYVGTKDLAAYLITTPAGHILIDGAVPSMAGEIEKSIRTLGFKPEDIKILLTTQAHYDHVGTLAHFQKLSKASVRVMEGDDRLVADGGKSDYLFGGRAETQFAPVKVDVVLKDGDTVSLGGVTLTAIRTPGHTRGCATYTMSVVDKGRTYAVVFPGSTTVNGGTRLVKTNARVIAATNGDLREAVESGNFREDLFYRLQVFDIQIPPLRDRRSDIPLLVDAFLAELGPSMGSPVAGVSEEAMDMLTAYAWPGNVRELRNVLERAAILCDRGVITTQHLSLNPGLMTSTTDLRVSERRTIEQVLRETGWNKAKAARQLGLTRTQLYVRLRKYDLEKLQPTWA